MTYFKKIRRYNRGFWWMWALLVCGIAFFTLMKLTDYTAVVQKLNYSEFITKVEEHKIAAVKIEEQFATGMCTDGSYFETILPAPFTEWSLLREHNVNIGISTPTPVLWYSLLGLIALAIAIAIWAFSRIASLGSQQSGGLYNMSKSKARIYLPSQIRTRFSSVAGAAEAKEDLADIIDFLKNPAKYHRLGAKLPRGILLVGAPGNGKTLLARATAGEANCRFIAVNGSDFIEVFVGVGAARVRDLFDQARKQAPCIIFIDEIDAVGRHRGSGLGGGNDEREQTLNQLLTEMDGFAESDKTVVVLAATNRVSVLDKALLRPGRFDRQIVVPYPDLASRRQILEVHAKDIVLDPTVDLEKLALATPGCTGADLQNIINEAAINASKKELRHVTKADLEEAHDRLLLGRQRSTISLTTKEREIIAYHEAGHALVNLLIPEYTHPLHKITILPRGETLGVTHFMPEKDTHLMTKEQFLASITVSLGGRAAEELIFGDVTNGISGDIQSATHVARLMVCSYGMSNAIGTVLYAGGSDERGPYAPSEKTAELIDQEVQRIIKESYERAILLLTQQRDKLELLAKTLLLRESMTALEVYELIDITPREYRALS